MLEPVSGDKDELLPAVTHTINSSLVSGVFPPEFKAANVNPLLKSLLLSTTIWKTIARSQICHFLSQLPAYLSSNNLFCPSQWAYRAEYSTETALLKVINDILRALEDGNISVLALLDLSAAFDTIDHKILLARLENLHGISGTALSWFESYLTGRTQMVTIDTNSSKLSILCFGVPQGSALGPVLFILYTKPLSKLIERHSISSESFADDTQFLDSLPFSHHCPTYAELHFWSKSVDGLQQAENK